MDLGNIQLPEKPQSLADVEIRHREIRRQRLEKESALRALETKLARAALGADDDAATVAGLVAGEITELGRQNLPDEANDLRRKVEVLVKADQELARRVTEERQRFNRQVAKAYRPAHRQAARKILEAVEVLIEANRAEESNDAVAPLMSLPHCAFPNVGRFGCNGGPAQYWREFVLRAYPDLMSDDPPAPTPKPKAKAKRRLFASRANGAAGEAVPMAAAGPETD